MKYNLGTFQLYNEEKKTKKTKQNKTKKQKNKKQKTKQNKKASVDRESNPGQSLRRQLCSPLYHHIYLFQIQ